MTDTTMTKPARRPRRMALEQDSTNNELAEVTGPASTDDGAEQASPTASIVESRVTKAAQVLALLQRPEGAGLDDMVALTGWLPHTTRAALTGLRKKGHCVTSVKAEDGRRIYRIDPAAAAMPDPGANADADADAIAGAD